MITGYTTGVYDLFHIGHLNILRNSRSLCDQLIVGVTVDELLIDYKGKPPIISFNERQQIVESVKYVDAVVPQYSMDKYEAWQKKKFDVMFVGDDWHNTPKWKTIEEKLATEGVKTIYFPYTKGTSSTLLNAILKSERSKLKSPIDTQS